MVLPGAADRILAMAETATNGASNREDKLADAEIRRAEVGQSMAFFLTLIALMAAIGFFALGQPIAGGVLVSFPVIMLIRSFLGRDTPKR